MTQLSTKTLAYLEEEFKIYPHIDRMIAIRKIELMERAEDTNIGGGKSNLPGDPTGNLAVKNISDPFIQRMEQRRSDIDLALKKMDPEQQSIVEMKFWGRNFYTWNEIADQYYCSSKTMYIKRYKILEVLAEIKGLTMDGMYL